MNKFKVNERQHFDGGSITNQLVSEFESPRTLPNGVSSMMVNSYKLLGAICLIMFLATNSSVALSRELSEVKLFQAGEAGYHTYRIPALVVANNADVLAFCEARKNSGADDGDIDLVLRRSKDGGKSWSELEVLFDDGEHTIGNPCPVLDEKSGTVWLFVCRNNREILFTKSRDHGVSWEKLQAIRENIVPESWYWVGTGPGHGIQLRDGRLLLPCWADATPRLGEKQFSWMLYSDDGGKSWKRSEPLPMDASDECMVSECSDGSIYFNGRSRQNKRLRVVSRSRDGGVTWEEVSWDSALPEPSCQGSTLRFSRAGYHDRERLLCAAPASLDARKSMTLRLSYDDGKSWKYSREVAAGFGAYSDLAATFDRDILLLYEGDDYQSIRLARFDIEWVTNGDDKPNHPIRYWHEQRSLPRKLDLHRVELNLDVPGWELAVGLGNDPDEEGPVEVELTPPFALAKRGGFVVGLNTNPWTMIPPTPAGQKPLYLPGAPADIAGWAKGAEGERSRREAGYWSFWLDGEGQTQLGDGPKGDANAKLAVSGFGGLLKDGKILPGPSDTLHPRSAIGLDATRRRVILLEVDGRQPGFSEGVSEYELAELMKEFGAVEALNLDGGGSSILVMQNAQGRFEALNKPSDAIGPRAIPVMLGWRRTN